MYSECWLIKIADVAMCGVHVLRRSAHLAQHSIM